MKAASLCRLVHNSCRQHGNVFHNGVSKVLAPAVVLPRRANTTSPNPYTFLNVKRDDQRGVAVIEMKRKPVNGLNLEFLTELNIAVEKAENDKTCKGIILTSALPVFSAGLELMEMYQAQPDRLRTFWRSFQDINLRLHSSPLVNIAAINGPAPAGGCALGLSCDYRIMADIGKNIIGLNESLIGIVAPYWLRQLAQYVMGHRHSDKMLQLGALYPPKEALRLGLVDELVPPEQLMETAQQQMDKWLAVPAAGRQLTKQLLRQPFVDEFHRRREEDENDFVRLTQSDAVQKMMGRYIESLKQRAK